MRQQDQFLLLEAPDITHTHTHTDTPPTDGDGDMLAPVRGRPCQGGARRLPEHGAGVVEGDVEHAVLPHALSVDRASKHFVHHL